MNSVHKYPRHDHDSSPPLPSYHRRLTPSPLMLTSFFSLGILNLPDSQVNRRPVFLTLHGPHLARVGLRITIHNTVEGRDIYFPLELFITPKDHFINHYSSKYLLHNNLLKTYLSRSIS